MHRTNVVVDLDLVDRVKELYGVKTTREAVELALRRLAGSPDPYEAALRLRGIGWDGDFEALRGHPLGE